MILDGDDRLAEIARIFAVGILRSTRATRFWQFGAQTDFLRKLLSKLLARTLNSPAKRG